MRKKLLNLVFALTLMIGILCFNSPIEVKAISQSSVQAKLQTLMNQYVGKTANSNQMYMGSQCKGFANWVFLNIFGVYIGPYPESANYRLSNPQAEEIGVIPPGNLNEASARNLLEKAAPGDYIQVQRSIAHSNGKCGPHSMIVVGIENDGVRVFDCNSDGINTIKSYLYTWSKFDYQNRAMSLYRARNYEYESQQDISLLIHAWISDTGMGNVPSSYEKGKRYYLCYELIDKNTGKRINDISNLNYQVTEIFNKPNGTFGYETYDRSDNNWINDVCDDEGTYRGIIKVSGDINGSAEVSFDVLANVRPQWKSWLSKTQMGDKAETFDIGKRCYFCCRVIDGNTSKDLNDVTNQYAGYCVTLSVYNPDGSLLYSSQFDNGDCDWIYFTPKQLGTYRAVATISGTLDGKKETKFTVTELSGHSWGSWKTVEDATCTKTGTKERTCSHCNIKESTSIPLKDHSYTSWFTMKDSTCISYGYKERVCCYCLKKETASIPLTNHKWKTSYSIDKPATCTETGSKSYHCENCNIVKSGSQRVIPAKGHNYKESVTKQPTCAETGIRTYTCSICRKSYTETIPLTNHKWKTSYSIDKPATCTETGSKSYHCENCNIVKSGSQRAIPAKGHNYKESVTKQPTCAETGIRTYTCSACRKSYTESIPLTNHKWKTSYSIDKSATCTETGSKSYHCENCNIVKLGSQRAIPAKGHNYKESVTKQPTCAETGIRTYTCSTCRKSYTESIPFISHEYVETVKKATIKNRGAFIRKCKICGKQIQSRMIACPKTLCFSKQSFTYNGKVQKPSIIITDSNGEIINQSNYSVKYSSGCKNVGKYMVTVTFKGKYYTGTIKETFRILPQSIKINSLKALKKGFSVKWTKKNKEIDGYQIQYDSNARFSKAKTIIVKGKSKASKEVKKLSGKKQYYVRIRTFKTVTVNGKRSNLYSAWSAAKKIITK